MPAGTALKVLQYLKIDPSKTRLALIMNTDSPSYGTKDIIKIENVEGIDLDVLGLVARQATVDIVRGGRIVEKVQPHLPERASSNVITCVEPALRDHHRGAHRPDVPPRAFAAGRNTVATTATRKPSSEPDRKRDSMITLHDVKVWDTGEVIDLVIPGTAADLLTDADRPFPARRRAGRGRRRAHRCDRS